ncbi:MAG: hypothetical protein F6J96_36035, partial [Symploca sp. SIO1C2]|nr:hypothetical protein [Symploca sp. SIO1C2]
SKNASQRRGRTLAKKTVGAAKSATKTAASTVKAVQNTVKQVKGAAQYSEMSRLNPLGVESVQEELPSFQPADYRVKDPLNPPESLPQVSQGEFIKASRIYEGATRAVQLTGKAFDLTRERFVVEGKKAKTFSAGVQAATAYEKVKSDLANYQTQLQGTKQSEIALGVAELQTTTAQAIAEQTEKELSEKLAIAQAGAELAQLQTQEKQTKLAEFKLLLTPQV